MTVAELIERLQKFDRKDTVLAFDPDMFEHLDVKDVSRRTQAPICVELKLGRN